MFIETTAVDFTDGKECVRVCVCCREDILAGLYKSKGQFDDKGKKLGSSWWRKHKNVSVSGGGLNTVLLKYLNAVWHVCDLYFSFEVSL